MYAWADIFGRSIAVQTMTSLTGVNVIQVRPRSLRANAVRMLTDHLWGPSTSKVSFPPLPAPSFEVLTVGTSHTIPFIGDGPKDDSFVGCDIWVVRLHFELHHHQISDRLVGSSQVSEQRAPLRARTSQTKPGVKTDRTE